MEIRKSGRTKDEDMEGPGTVQGRRHRFRIHGPKPRREDMFGWNVTPTENYPAAAYTSRFPGDG